LPPGAV